LCSLISCGRGGDFRVTTLVIILGSWFEGGGGVGGASRIIRGGGVGAAGSWRLIITGGGVGKRGGTISKS